MNIEIARQKANELMKKHGLIELGWRFEFDRANRRFGCCKYSVKKITLSQSLTELNNEENVIDTILHEIAHALVGYKHKHNHVWRSKALEIGCNGNRCYSSIEVETPDAPYQAVCSGCNHIHKKYRRPRAHIRTSCGHCSGGKFNPTYQLNWVRLLP